MSATFVRRALVCVVACILVAAVCDASAAYSPNHYLYYDRDLRRYDFTCPSATSAQAGTGSASNLAGNLSQHLSCYMVATADYNESYEAIGWDKVTIAAVNATQSAGLPAPTSTAMLLDQLNTTYFGMGYLEGYLSQRRSFECFNNFVNATLDIPAEATAFIHKQIEELRARAMGVIQGGSANNSIFDVQFALFWFQLEGMYAGYVAAVNSGGTSSSARHHHQRNSGAQLPNNNASQDLSFLQYYANSFNPEINDVVHATTKADAYDKWRMRQEQLTFYEYYANSFYPEMDDVVRATRPPGSAPVRGWQARRNRHRQPPHDENNHHPTHCSAFVKWTGDDIFLGHSTWFQYNAMLRQYKTYTYDGLLNGATIAQSSFAASLSSTDDYYTTSHQLLVTETSLSLDGPIADSLARKYITTSEVPEFLRVMVANALADSGKEWVELFSTRNSGTVNNQYMVVDLKRFEPGATRLKPGLFWIAEQLPGSVTSADMTGHLQNTSYWASYNIPYFPNVNRDTGNAGLEREYGSFYSYHKYARAEIFAHHHTSVVDLPSMQSMMRYNEWQTDPFSRIPNCTGAGSGNTCSPDRSSMLSIAARGDLAPADDPHNIGPLAGSISFSLFGAIDTKVSAASLWHNVDDGVVMSSSAVCGPTADAQAPFNYSQYPRQYTNLLGIVPYFNFPFHRFTVSCAKPGPAQPWAVGHRQDPESATSDTTKAPQTTKTAAPVTHAPTPSTTPSPSSPSSKADWIPIVVGAGVFAVVVAMILFLLSRRRVNDDPMQRPLKSDC